MFVSRPVGIQFALNEMNKKWEKTAKSTKNADVCSALFRVRVRTAEQKSRKTSIFVPGCRRRGRET
jgi:hypothetical protein